MASVFVVFGRTGEYSDLTEWPVKAYASQENAQACVDRCNSYAGEFKTDSDDLDYRNRFEAQNPDDSSMRIYYTGTEYYLCEIELADDMLPQQVAADEVRRRAIKVGSLD